VVSKSNYALGVKPINNGQYYFVDSEMIALFLLLLTGFACGESQPHGHIHHAHRHYHQQITSSTLAGDKVGCGFPIEYSVNPNIQFRMCSGQTLQETKNGRSIIEMIKSRGYMPTCRVQHLLLWMYSSINEITNADQTYFADVGANIGSCSVHMASLGIPVISIEPVEEHMKAIRGTMAMNPSFRIEPHHIGMSSTERVSKGKFVHGPQNWGSTVIVEDTEAGEQELVFSTLDYVLRGRKVALLKVDCEGCEYAALKGASKSLAADRATRVDMMKMEVNMAEYPVDFNSTESVPAKAIISLLHEHNYELFVDMWREEYMYFGHSGDTVQPIDNIFGSRKFSLRSDLTYLDQAAKLILSNPIDPDQFTSHVEFNKLSTDIIAIDAELAAKMRKKWL
jgi:FkbM family methyltransferase